MEEEQRDVPPSLPSIVFFYTEWQRQLFPLGAVQVFPLTQSLAHAYII